MTPITMTKNSEVADYGSVPSSPGDDGETMHLIQKQVDEATTMAKEVKRNSLLSASLLIGAAALFFAGYAFSLSVSTQMQSELPVLGDWYHIGWHPIGYWPDYVPKDELATFCNFESFDIDSPDFASHPCARCYLIGLFEPYGDQDIRHDTSYAEGRLDFAKCYFKGIKDQGREPSKADYTMKPYDIDKQTCQNHNSMKDVEWIYQDYFTENSYWDHPSVPVVTKDGFDNYASDCFNDYFFWYADTCSSGENWGYMGY